MTSLVAQSTLLCPDTTEICKDVFGSGDLGNIN